jgi:hypothetical protein
MTGGFSFGKKLVPEKLVNTESSKLGVFGIGHGLGMGIGSSHGKRVGRVGRQDSRGEGSRGRGVYTNEGR